MGEHEGKNANRTQQVVGGTSSAPVAEQRDVAGKRTLAETQPATHAAGTAGGRYKPTFDIGEIRLPWGAEKETAQTPTQQSFELPEQTHRDGLIDGIQIIQTFPLTLLEHARTEAMKAIEDSDVPERSEVAGLLSTAVSTALAAAGGAIAGYVAGAITGGVGAATVASLAKSAIKSALHLNLGPSPENLKHIKKAFDGELARHLRESQRKLLAAWSQTHDALAKLSTPDLTEAHDRAVTAMGTHDQLVAKLTTEMLVAWTNFLARAKHGAAQRGWDYWSDNGGGRGVRLEGAERPMQQDVSSRTDPMDSNVDPSKLQWALDGTQRPMQADHFGILEIFLTSGGAFLDVPGYGMRLDNVGKDVRAHLRKLGHVRELKVNKIVRMCSMRIYPPKPLFSVLITADGYVRAEGFDAVSYTGRTDPKQLAEVAQDLSLTHLKE